jgi:hypothetical protein
MTGQLMLRSPVKNGLKTTALSLPFWPPKSFGLKKPPVSSKTWSQALKELWKKT